jgi:hypothetical protein
MSENSNPPVAAPPDDGKLPPGHRVLLDAVEAMLRAIPESAASLSAWLAGESLVDAEPKVGEYPQWCNNRLCANPREKRRSLSLGPAAPAAQPASPYSWGDQDAALSAAQRAAEAQRQTDELNRWKFTHGT